ncbi:MAG: PfaB family protein [Thermodesulfobacteriota bacterium]
MAYGFTEKIAITGMSCLFPGANSPEGFFQNLLEKRDLRSRATPEDWGLDPERTFDPAPGKTDRTYCLMGGFVRGFSFDAQGFLLPPETLEPLDRTCQWSLSVARQALSDARLSCGDPALSRCGLVLANLSFPTRQSNRLFIPLYHRAVEEALLRLSQDPGFALAPMPGEGSASPYSARISGGPARIVQKALGLSGLSFALDAACASSLYALKLAADALLSGRCDIMLAGAVSAADPLFVSMGFSLFTAYPKKGGSAPLSQESQGLYAGEGAGIFVVKRLSDAMAAGDRIYAVVEAVGLSNDGRGASVLSPAKKGQIMALSRAYEAAGLSPADVSYVECHATGTPVGDKVELDTVETFFGERETYPKLGSVKSNLGHLLTAAGMAGMIKVILSLEKQIVPATINVKSPMQGPAGRLPASSVVTENLPLPREKGKLAAVSAFGFGGTNAHALFSRDTEKGRARAGKIMPRPRLAVVGMGCHYGGLTDLDAALPAILGFARGLDKLPEERWHGLEKMEEFVSRLLPGQRHPPAGAYIKEFLLDFFRFKVPPRMSERLIAQHLLLLLAADAAIRHAGLAAGSDAGVVVAMETELSLHRFRGRVSLESRLPENAFAGRVASGDHAKILSACKDAVQPAAGANQYTSFIGNIMACRVSSLWDFSGAAFTVSSGNLSAFHALETAWGMLSAGDCSSVVLGAVDLCGGAENILVRLGAQAPKTEKAAFHFAGSQSLPRVCEGAGAVVLKSLEDAIQQKDRILAVLDGLGFGAGECGAASRAALNGALAQAELMPESISCLEFCTDEFGRVGGADARALAEAFGKNGEDKRVCIGSASSSLGHAGAGSGMLALIRSAAALSQRTFPGSPDFTANAGGWEQGPLFSLQSPRPWFAGEGGHVRRLGVWASEDDTAAFLVASEAPDGCREEKALSLRPRTLLFPLAAQDAPALSAALLAFSSRLREHGDISRLAAECLGNLVAGNRLRMVLAASSREELVREAAAMADALDGACKTGKDFVTPAGSCFAPVPLYPEAKVAFVYPGGFMSYPEMARELLALFPELWGSLLTDPESLGRMFSERLVYPRRMGAADSAQKASDLSRLVGHPITMFETGILTSIALTDVMTRRFGLKPHMAIGYSMGEVSMMYALSVWERDEAMSRKLHRVPVFRTRLAGPMETMREAWGLPDKGESVWQVVTVLAEAERVRAAVAEENRRFPVPRVFVTFVNTPRETVISGHPESCSAVVKRLSAKATPVDMSDAIHCELVRSEFSALADLHRLPVKPVPGVSFYSAVRLGPLPEITSDAVAENIAEVYCRCVDFSALVEKAYQDGARIFVELGPRDSCTRWIKENLAGRPHLCIPTNRRGASDEAMLGCALAALFTHGAPVDLSFFCGPAPGEKETREKTLVQPVSTGGPDMEQHILSACKGLIAPVPAVKAPKVDNPVASAPPKNSAPLWPAPSPEQPREAVPRAVLSGKEQPLPKPANSADDLRRRLYEPFSRNMEAFADAHRDFLARRKQALEDAAGYLDRLMDDPAAPDVGETLPAPAFAQSSPSPEPAQADIYQEPPPLAPSTASARSGELTASLASRKAALAEKPQTIVFDQKDLLTFAEGKISDVFGPEYAAIDPYKRRVRLPMPPYLLVTRVTRLSARRGEFKPSTMTTEYDIPENAWHAIDGQAPWAVCVESGQCDLLLISFLGIDFSCKSERVYRLLDCTLTFLGELPKEGQTLSYDISINSFARSGEGLLFFFSYRCFADGVPILNMDGGCAGFFTDRELAAGKGVIRTEAELKEIAQAKKQSFTPLLRCPESVFPREKLARIIEGDMAGCFGSAYDLQGRNPSLRFATEMMLMVDRVVSLDPTGGPWGLGEVVAEKDLAPDAWYFTCHFKDDPVLAGSLMAEGCVQLLQFFMLYLGLGTLTEDARFQPVPGLPQKVRCRGQVIPGDPRLTYRMQVKRIETSPAPLAVADVDILLNGKVVVDFKDLGVLIKEKQAGDPHAAKRPVATPAARKAPPELPAAPLAEETIFTKQDLTEFAVGSLSKCFGPAFDIYENRQPPRTPNGYLQLMDRVAGMSGEPGRFKEPATVISEFFVPEDFWFIAESAQPDRIPYSMLMEIALQPCGFVSTWMQTTQLRPNMDFFFRNLDGEGTILREVDLRGRLIQCRATLLLTTAAAGSIIQKFSFTLSESGEPFYKGTAAFGYFVKDALTNQVGLDQGALNNPYRTREYLTPDALHLDLLSPETQKRFGQGPQNAPRFRENGPMLRFLDFVDFVPDGGKHSLGYLAAVKKVDPKNWFYPCHFHKDPVMPGSLGVEAILETMRIFCLQTGLGADISDACFDMPLSRIVWKYRGQITPANDRMTLDVHIKDVSRSEGRITVLADANLWKDEIRIYEITDAALRIRSA